ncbi:MAG: fatty acid desaturase [Verrucomicrobia bacterium]|nr:fatty acid desaturase [Verrucomicrobiota bacterium]
MLEINTSSTNTLHSAEKKQPESWRAIVRKYQKPSLTKGLWQLTNSGIPYVGLWILMYFTTSVSWPLTIALCALASLFIMRLFIIFHDCGHGSFFKSRKANNIVGFLIGILTFTPYRHWTWQHAAHHGTSGNLDERGLGDIWTMTVNEFKEASSRTRLLYRFSRNPVVLFVLAPFGFLAIYQRFPVSSASKRDRYSVHLMNFSLLLYVVGMSFIFGFWNYLWIQLSIMTLSGTLGIWLFYVQHQFEDTYWRSNEEWDYASSALAGSSFYKLPAILNWFSGNIGYHHIHHLSSRIPNYNLQACHRAEPFFQQVPELTLAKSLKSLNLRLWDEDTQKLVGYRFLRNKNHKRSS